MNVRDIVVDNIAKKISLSDILNLATLNHKFNEWLKPTLLTISQRFKNAREIIDKFKAEIPSDSPSDERVNVLLRVLLDYHNLVPSKKLTGSKPYDSLVSICAVCICTIELARSLPMKYENFLNSMNDHLNGDFLKHQEFHPFALYFSRRLAAKRKRKCNFVGTNPK